MGEKRRAAAAKEIHHCWLVAMESEIENQTAPTVRSAGKSEISCAREQFMRRVRHALGRSTTVRPTDPTPLVDESLIRLAGADVNLIDLFAQNASEIGMKVHRLQAVDLADRVVAVLIECEAKRVMLSVNGEVRERLLIATIGKRQIEVINWRNTGGFDIQYGADVGITDVHAALAETGTLICCTDARSSRGLSLVPPIHVAIVRASDVVPDMIDYWARFQGIPNMDIPSSIAMITGPSKTADIEGELNVGVHGPGQVHILLTEDE